MAFYRLHTTCDLRGTFYMSPYILLLQVLQQQENESIREEKNVSPTYTIHVWPDWLQNQVLGYVNTHSKSHPEKA